MNKFETIEAYAEAITENDQEWRLARTAGDEH
jgi:hypothetical protein